jgi:hypothetical protein
MAERYWSTAYDFAHTPDLWHQSATEAGNFVELFLLHMFIHFVKVKFSTVLWRFRRLLSTVRIRFHVPWCGISGWLSVTGTCFSSSISFFNRQYYPAKSPHLFQSSKLLFAKGQRVEAWGPSDKSDTPSYIGGVHEIKVAFLFYYGTYLIKRLKFRSWTDTFPLIPQLLRKNALHNNSIFYCFQFTLFHNASLQPYAIKSINQTQLESWRIQ